MNWELTFCIDFCLLGSGSQTFPSSPWTAEGGGGGGWSSYNPNILASPIVHPQQQQQPVPSRISQSEHATIAATSENIKAKTISSPSIKAKHAVLHGKHQHHSTPQQLHQVFSFLRLCPGIPIFSSSSKSLLVLF